MFNKPNKFLSVIAGGSLLTVLFLFEPRIPFTTNPTIHTQADKAQTEEVVAARAQTDPTETLKNLNNSLAAIAARANPAVVTIKSKQNVKVQRFDPLAQFFGRQGGFTENQVREGLGSGVIVSKDGYILTNNHVVDGADELLIGILGSEDELVAKVVGTDPQTDIAVLKVDKADLPILELGNSDELRVGEIVIAVGSPLDAGLAHTVTMGIVSARGRANLQLAEYEDFIQTDAAINPGNSGGALVNLDGDLIGINTAIASRSGGYQGIGFSIPINMARNVMESLIKYGKVTRGFIGVYMQEVTPEIAKALDLKSADGVIVNQVEPNSPASKAGLKEGDIIRMFDGKTVKNSISLKNQVAQTKPGNKVSVEVLRDGDSKKLTLVLDEKGGSDKSDKGSVDENSLSGTLKFDFETLDQNLSNKYRVDSSVEGVIVTDIDARSSAYRNGLREGDVILSVNNAKTKDAKSFEKAMKKFKKGSAVMFRVLRRGSNYYFGFEL